VKSYTVVTTFNADGYKLYGQKMIQSWLANWPSSVNLVVYTENCNVNESAPNLTVLDLNFSSPELVAFKQKWQNDPRANGDISKDLDKFNRKDAKKTFKWDAIRFSHKVYSIFDCARRVKTDWLIWMDADTICHSPIDLDTIITLCPEQYELCFLGRANKYTECGLYAINLQSEKCQYFLQKFQELYDQAETGIFTLTEWHDSFVFDAVRKLVPLQELDWSGHLISGEGHPLINTEWGAYLDHLKGGRKQLGRSKLSDLKIARKEKYWQ
jgi:hypothetical protein